LISASRRHQKTLKIDRVPLTEVSVTVVEERVRLLGVFRERFRVRGELAELIF